MTITHSAVHVLNQLGRSITMSRNTLDAVTRIIDAKLPDTFKALNGDYKDLSSVTVVYYNIHAPDKDKIFDSDFMVAGVFANNAAALRFIATERNATPNLTYRLLELFEGKFHSFIEYPSVHMRETAAA